MSASQNGVRSRRRFLKTPKVGPWLLIIIINELDVPAADLWKYLDNRELKNHDDDFVDDDRK